MPLVYINHKPHVSSTTYLAKGNAEETLKKPDIILVSTLKRTLQTASIVFNEFRNCPETRWIASDVIREAVQEHPWTSPSERKPCNYRDAWSNSFKLWVV